MRKRAIGAIAFLLTAAALWGQNRLTLAFLSDEHAPCYPGGPFGKYPGVTGCNYAASLANVVRGWSPNYIISGGDITRNRGNLSEASRGIYVNALTPVATPGTVTVEIDSGTRNGNLYIFGSELVAGGPYLMGLNTKLAVDEGTAQFEIVTVTAVPDAAHFTAAFSKTHTAPFLVRGAAFTLYQDFVVAGRYVPALGNHDSGGGGVDYCNDGGDPACPMDGSWAALRSVFADSWFSGGKPYYTATLGGLVTVFVLDSFNIGGDGIAYGSVQELKFRADMASCATPWCIAVLHHPPYSSCASYVQAATRWAAGTKVQLVLSGHAHTYERVTAQDYAGARTLNYVVAGNAGGTMDVSGCTTCTGCMRQAAFNDWGAVRLEVDRGALTLSAYDKDGLLRDSLHLTKHSQVRGRGRLVGGQVR